MTGAARGDVAAGAVLLEVEDLRVEFTTPNGPVRAVDGISLQLHRGEVLAIMGESGCGKSVTMQAIMGLVRTPPGRVWASCIRFDGIDLLQASAPLLRTIRGPRIAMIFQDPFMSLDPTRTVGDQIGEMFRVHRGASRAAARAKAIELMEKVRIPSARQRVDSYPFQFSGGMSQRIMIASAIALDPQILIADEPTTALDVTVQAQIMDILGELRRELGMAMILITHDIRLAAEAATRAIVMYAGRVAESGPMASLYAAPRHPYTIGLLRSLPDLLQPDVRLQSIAGVPPVLAGPSPGCAFEPRCAWARARCSTEVPPLRALDAKRRCACHFAEEIPLE